jgi:hypothetical protein
MKSSSIQEAVMLRVKARARSRPARWATRAAALLFILLTTSVLPSGQAPAPDSYEPVVWIASPDDDETVSGIVTVGVEAFDASGVAGVIFEVDGAAVGAEDVAAPWSFAWDANASGVGSHILTVVARDTVGNAARSDVVPVVVGGDVTPPPPPPPPPNLNPVAIGDSFMSAGRVPVSFTDASLLGNDSDADGHALAVSAVASASSGGGIIASLGGGSYKYTPAATFSGVDTFDYSIGDGHGGTASAVVSVNVNVTAPAPAPPAGLVLAFGFDEASGTSAINSANAAFNGTIRQALRVAGKFGGALSFDGVNDWVTVTDTAASPLDLTTGLTIAAWVNPTSLAGWDTVVLKERGAGLLSYALYAHDGAPDAGGFTAPAAYVRAGGTDAAVRDSFTLRLNTWTHLAATYDGVRQRLFINGVLVATHVQAGPVAVGNGALRIGGNNVFAGEFYQGLIDEVRIYNRALSAADVAAAMIAPVVP